MDTKDEDGLQLIGIGLPRTGTSSIQAALAMIGVKPVHHMTVRELSNVGRAVQLANAPALGVVANLHVDSDREDTKISRFHIAFRSARPRYTQ